MSTRYSTHKSAFKELFDAARNAETQIHEPASLLCKRLHARIAGGADSAAAAPTASMTNGEPSSASTNEVSSLHSKFCQDPHFKGIRGKFVRHLIAVFRRLVLQDDAQEHRCEEGGADHHQQNRCFKARAEQA